MRKTSRQRRNGSTHLRRGGIKESDVQGRHRFFFSFSSQNKKAAAAIRIPWKNGPASLSPYRNQGRRDSADPQETNRRHLFLINNIPHANGKSKKKFVMMTNFAPLFRFFLQKNASRTEAAGTLTRCILSKNEQKHRAVSPQIFSGSPLRLAGKRRRPSSSCRSGNSPCRSPATEVRSVCVVFWENYFRRLVYIISLYIILSTLFAMKHDIKKVIPGAREF